MCDKCVLHDKHDMCVLKSIAKPIKRTVAFESIKKLRNFTWKIYEHVSKTCSWWYPKSTPSGYIWKPKSRTKNVNLNLVEIVLFIIDSGYSKHMTGNLKLLINFMKKFLGTIKFGNDQIAPILGYGDLVQGAITIKRVYYVEGLNHNLFSVGQLCDADLEVSFRKSTCFIRDLKRNDLLLGMNHILFFVGQFCDADLEVAFRKSTCYIRDLKRNDLLTGLSKEDFKLKRDSYQTSVARTPEQNGVVERRNRTLIEAAQTMLSATKVPLFFWAEAIATTCFTQNRSLVIP
nr:integrase, catalytic region, zinc finger, CCHC-type, peptidase aspartic, catalytic [Tanacetum cinerariifolium]